MTWEALLTTVGDRLADDKRVKPDTSWVIGVSGGPDSTVLARVMAAVAERHGWRGALHVAHLHHGLRGREADEDAAFVRELADELGLPFHFEQIDVRSQVRERGGSTEEVARESRYEFLERVALRTGSDAVAVAHHADDNAETIIHRVVRGTGLRGLGGMNSSRAIREGSRILLIRPFLSIRRSAIEAVALEKGFSARLDSTNQSPGFTRGRIRTRILPALREALNPNVTDAVLRLAEQARWMSQYLADAGDRAFDSMVVAGEPRHVVLNKHALLSKQRIIQAEVIRRAVSLVLGHEQDLGFTHIEAVLRLAEDPRSGKEVHLPGPVLVQRLYGRIDIRPLEEREHSAELGLVHVVCPGETALPPPIAMELSAEICAVDASILESLRNKRDATEEWLDLACVRLPLLVRGRRDGDRFHPLGAPGAKTLSDFLIGEKIDPAVRARTGVLCDQEGPIWIMPLRIDERVKLRAASRKALRLKLRGPRGNSVERR